MVWIEKKCRRKSKNPNILLYDLKSYNCDICKKKYPKLIKFKNELVPLLQIKEPEKCSFAKLSIVNIESKLLEKIIIIKF